MLARRRRVIFARAAYRDLAGIYDYIASDNPGAAERQVRSIVEACASLVEFAERGPARPDLSPGLRQLLVLPYIVFYHIKRDRIEVARILHGRRNAAGEFAPPGGG